MPEKKKAPERATIQARHKDSTFDAVSQPIPCIGCADWQNCGRFLWAKCPRMGRYLKLRKEARNYGY